MEYGTPVIRLFHGLWRKFSDWHGHCEPLQRRL